MSKKATIKLNKNHEGKEFSNNFHFVGKVKPVRKKDENDNWYDVEIYDVNKTKTDKDRRVLQFVLETAFKNELKLELAGMEGLFSYVYSSKDKKSHRLDWSERHDKSKYPNETYHLIESDWDKAERLGSLVEADMWVDVKGKYEFSSFVDDEGKTINVVKRVIEQLTPLKNGEVIVTGVKEGETFRAYDALENGKYLGMGKANKEGITTIKVGWLNKEGGKVYICKVENDVDGKLTEIPYNDSILETGRITVKNNVPTSPVRVPKQDGQGYEYISYVRDFKDENFVEVNSFEMQVGIKSTYQDELTLDTIINGVYLDYGKERSVPKDVELKVYNKDASEGKQSLATAMSRLNRLDFLVVQGVDNNRVETAWVEVVESDDDNPFDDVEDKVTEYEQATTGTRKGLEVLKYIQGTYTKELLTEDEISDEKVGNVNKDPFVTEVDEDMLPF